MATRALRRRVVPLCAAVGVLAACSPSGDDEQAGPPDPATAVVTASYENASLPPPYHYAWDLVAQEGQVSVTWRAGYEQDGGPTWEESARYTTAQLGDVLTRLDSGGCLDLEVTQGDAGTGGPYVEEFAVRDGEQVWSVVGPTAEESVPAISDCLDIVQELAPEQIWEQLQDRQGRGGESQ